MAFAKLQQPPPPRASKIVPGGTRASKIVPGGSGRAEKGSRSISPVPSSGSARGGPSRRPLVVATRTPAGGPIPRGSLTVSGDMALRSPTPTPDETLLSFSSKKQVSARNAHVGWLERHRKAQAPPPAPSKDTGSRRASPSAPLHHQHLVRAGATTSSWREARRPMSAEAVSRDGSPLLHLSAGRAGGPIKARLPAEALGSSPLAAGKAVSRSGKAAPPRRHESPLLSSRSKSPLKGGVVQQPPSAGRQGQEAAAQQKGSRQLQLHRMDVGSKSLSPGRFDFAASNQVRPAATAARALTNLGVSGWSRPGPTRQLSRGRTPSPELRTSKSEALRSDVERAPRPFHVPKRISKAAELELRDGWRMANVKQGLFAAEVEKASSDIESAKKEVKKLRDLTNRKDWDVRREEQRQMMLNIKRDLDSYRLYRQEEEMGFQELAMAQAKALLREKLRLSKEHLDFKQEMKEASHQRERQHIAHERDHYLEHQSQQRALKADFESRCYGAQAYRRELLQQDVEGRERSRLRDTTEALESKAHEKRLELAQTMKSLEAQRQLLLEKSAYTDRVRSASPMSELAQRLTSAQAQRIAPPPRNSQT